MLNYNFSYTQLSFVFLQKDSYFDHDDIYYPGNGTFWALNIILYFRKLNFSTLTLKSSFFFFRRAHHCFFKCFHFTITIDFYYCFRVFSLLIAFVHFITVLSGVFIYHWFYYRFSSVLISRTFFTVTVFCYFVFVLLYRKHFGFESVFFNLKRFLPDILSQHLAQLAFIKASLGPVVEPWSLQGLPMRFETQSRSICLLKSHSVQQKVLADRFYLCIRGCNKLLY